MDSAAINDESCIGRPVTVTTNFEHKIPGGLLKW